MADAKETAKKAADTAKQQTETTMNAAAKNAEAFTNAGQNALREGFERTASAMGDINEQGKRNLDAVIQSFSAATKNAEAINSNLVSYSKDSMERSVAAAKEMASARSVQEVIELQSDYAKASLDSYLSEVNKASELFSNMMKDAWRPLNERAADAFEQAQAQR